jgi:iron complex transport system substrate-binding protein
MKRFMVSGLITLVLVGSLQVVRAGEIVDATGRSVTLPAPVTRVAAAGPPAEVLLYAFAPDAMIGWIRDIPAAVAPFITPQAKALPTVGAVTAQGEDPDISDILAAKPQLIVDFGDVDRRYIDLAARIQSRTGVPYVLLDGALTKMPETFRALGKLTGREARGEELAIYSAEILARVEDVASAHRARPIRVYVARSADGASATRSGSNTGDVYDFAGLENVAENNYGLPGEVRKLDPDMIVALDARFLEVAKGEAWSRVRAVQEGKIVVPPRLPWGWTDHPPSVGRILGALWLTSTIYGVPSKDDLRAETVRFFKLFYHADLSLAQAEALIP